MKKAVIYCRVSTEKQEDNTSLDTQEAACRDYAKLNGYEVMEVVREVYTGTALWERPLLSKLRENVRRREIDAVISYSTERLSRDATHLAVLFSEADHNKVAIEFVSEPFDNFPEGELIRYMRGYSGKIEHTRFQDRSKRGRESRARSGKPLPGATPPLGYKWLREEGSEKPTVVGWEIDLERAPLVKRIFNHVAKGGSVTSLAAAFNEEGIPTAKWGRLWYHKTLCIILQNPIYKGEPETLKAQYETVGGKPRKLRDTPKEDRIKLSAPPLVSPELWHMANDQLKRNKTESKRRNQNPEAYLLRSGFAFCGYCGGPLISSIHCGEPKYRCSVQNMTLRNCPGGGTMVAKELDEEVWSRVLQVIAHPEVLLKEVEAQLSQPGTAEKDLESLDRELAKIERQQKATANAISLLDNEEAYAPLVEKLQLLASQKKELEREREIVLSRRNDLLTLVGLMDKLERDFAAMEEAIANLSYQEKRAVLNSLGVKVKLWQMKHSPRFQIEMDVDLNQLLLDPTREPEDREIEEGQWVSPIFLRL